MKKSVWFIIIALIISCSSGFEKSEKTKSENEILKLSEIDLQGHRGARGLMPENTWPSFKKALELGVKTLEMDAVITNDRQVLVSHEPWFSHEICLTPEGKTISSSDEKSHRIFEMTYEEIKAYDCGLKPHPHFPEQVKMAVSKPLLAAVIDSAEAYSVQMGRPLPHYNIETKSLPSGDGTFHPEPEEFVKLLVDVVKEKGISERVTIQSFDFRTLKIVKRDYPDIATAALIEMQGSAENHLQELGFTPDIYSPNYHLVNEELISFAKEKGMKVIPWTVNEKSEMKKLIEMGVDGIITDYPDRFNSLEE